MAFPPVFLERLRSHFPLSEVIGKRIALKKHGKEYMGLCPFHGEKTPSFTVNNDKGFFHCFGCAAHGDAIEFVKRYEHLTFVEAIEKLAGEAGIPIPAMSREAVAQAEQHKSLEGAMEAACGWYEQNLRASTHVAARDYLQGRGITDATIAQFRIGYAPESRDGLKRHLLTKGFTEAQLVEAGLIIKPDNGNTYDRFRERIMFPIRSASGRVIAFGGRLMGNAAKHLPKYLNSPETPLFHKGEVLFNLDRAGPVAREKGEIVIVEGYMDVVAMVQGGFAHTVATLGTAVTQEHLRKLWHYAPEPVLCLDGDAAGMRAMLRAAEIALPLLVPGQTLRFATLPDSEDPDSLIRHHGAEALTRVLFDAKGLPEMLWHHFSAEVGAGADARAALEHRLSEMSKHVVNQTIRNHYRSFFSKQIWARTFPKPGEKETRPRPRAVEASRLPDATPLHLQVKTVRQLLKILLTQPALLRDAEIEEHVSRMDCINPTLDGLRGSMMAHVCEGGIAASEPLVDLLSQEGFAHAVTGLLRDDTIILPRGVADSLETARVIWRRLLTAESLAAMEQEYRELQFQIAGQVDDASYERLLELQKQLKDLRKARASEDSSAENDGSAR